MKLKTFLFGSIALSIGLMVSLAAYAEESIKDKLDAKISLQAEPGPLNDVIGFISERYDLPLKINKEAFKKAGIKDVESTSVALPKTENQPLNKVLQLILDQVDGTYQIEKDCVRIVPKPPIKN